MKMRKVYFIGIFLFIFLCGCTEPGSESLKPAVKAGAVFLTVDFERSQKLVYKFVSSRDIEVLLEDPRGPEKSSTSKYSESIEMVYSYNPVKVSEYSMSIIEAKCESVKVKRSYSAGRGVEAAKKSAGRSFTFEVSPSGKIESHDEFTGLLKELGESAFRTNQQGDRIKDPDMLSDITATQWFLWDSVSSIPRPLEGVVVGERWDSRLSIPTPVVTNEVRDVEYSLGEIRQTEEGSIAVIDSSYGFSGGVPSWPLPYSGRFQQAGPLGIYIRQKITDLKGSGQELFNIDKGRTEKYEQNYEVNMTASLMIPIVHPKIKIKQKITMELVDDGRN